jgi:hypothetical protein
MVTASTALRPRDGGSLAATVIVLLVLDCVILGTLHLAMLERAMAGSAIDTLRLRLAGDEGLAVVIAGWDARLDSLPPAGVAPIATVPGTDGVAVRVTAERRAPLVVLLRATASLPAPRFGRATAALLVVPPLLPPEFSAGGAPVHAADGVELGPDGLVTGPGGEISAAADAIQRMTAAAGLLHGRQGVVIQPGGSPVDTSCTGVVFSAGDVTIQAGTVVTGLLISAGDVRIEPGAAVVGAVLAGGHVHVAGAVHFDALTVSAAIAAARLAEPVPLPGRGRLPAF